MVVLISGNLLMSEGCIFGRRESREVRQADKATDKMVKENQAEFEKAYKRHMESQSELTKKQMKEMKKQQKRANKLHQRSLWDRLFRNKCR